MPKETSHNEVWPRANLAAMMQDWYTLGDTELGFTSSQTIPGTGSITSNLIHSDGYGKIAVGAKSAGAGAVNLQRYIDDAGTIPQGAPLTVALVANTFAVLNITDGFAFSTFTVNITNTTGSAVALSNFGLLLQTM